MSNRKLNILLLLAIVASMTILISNLAATKLWDFCGIAVDGGIVIFPISYIIGDVIEEIYGAKISKKIILYSFIMNFFASIVFLIVGALPEYPGWGMQNEYEAILGFAPRITLGSLAAYVTANLVNIYVFEKIRKKTNGKWLAARSLGSSAIARLFDSAIFETVAFIGVLSFGEFAKQAIFAYIAGMCLEILLTPITYLVVGRIKSSLNEIK